MPANSPLLLACVFEMLKAGQAEHCASGNKGSMVVVCDSETLTCGEAGITSRPPVMGHAHHQGQRNRTASTNNGRVYIGQKLVLNRCGRTEQLQRDAPPIQPRLFTHFLFPKRLCSMVATQQCPEAENDA